MPLGRVKRSLRIGKGDCAPWNAEVVPGRLEEKAGAISSRLGGRIDDCMGGRWGERPGPTQSSAGLAT